MIFLFRTVPIPLQPKQRCFAISFIFQNPHKLLFGLNKFHLFFYLIKLRIFPYAATQPIQTLTK